MSKTALPNVSDATWDAYRNEVLRVNPIANLFRVPELKEKILFTLLALAIYRFGAHVTVPSVDYVALQQAFGQLANNTILGVYDMFVGGALSRATVFGLGIMPYISASIMFQLLGRVGEAVPWRTTPSRT